MKKIPTSEMRKNYCWKFIFSISKEIVINFGMQIKGKNPVP
jgi:hypothetical protein